MIRMSSLYPGLVISCLPCSTLLIFSLLLLFSLSVSSHSKEIIKGKLDNVTSSLSYFGYLPLASNKTTLLTLAYKALIYL